MRWKFRSYVNDIKQTPEGQFSIKFKWEIVVCKQYVKNVTEAGNEPLTIYMYQTIK